jgi:hypothetical protein
MIANASNQPMKPTAPLRNAFSVFATPPAVAYLFLVRSMPTEIPRFESLIGTIVSILVAAGAPKGKRVATVSGCSFASIGVIFLLAGRIPQRWDAGPPVEG